jgi:hypothetical protein
MDLAYTGAYWALFTILFVWGCYVTTFMPVWKDRATHLQTAHVITGEVVSVRHRDDRGACRIYLRYGEGQDVVAIT